MDCKKYEEIILTDYADGRIAGPERKELEAHIASCEKCRSLASDMTAINARFREAKRMAPAPQVWENIRSSLAEGSVNTSFVPDLFYQARLFFTHFRPAIVAVTAASIILAVMMTARLMPHKDKLLISRNQDEIMEIVTMDENGNGTGYNFGTAEENYFL